MAFLDLKWGQDLENRATQPHQLFPGVSPGPVVLECHQMSYVPENEVHMQMEGDVAVFFSGITFIIHIKLYRLFT